MKLSYYPMIHFIPIVNRVADLLPPALEGCRALWPITTIIDNRDTPEECAIEIGTMAPNIDVFRPPVPLTTAQTMNLMLQQANCLGARFFSWQHLDAQCLSDSAEKLHAIAGEHLDRGIPWGVLFTNYDAYAAYNVDALNHIRGWDWKRFPYYFLDNDLHQRLNDAGYPCIETHLPVSHPAPSQTIRSNKERWLINGPMYEASETLFQQKHPSQRAIQKQWREQGMLFLHHIRNTGTYADLAAVQDSPEGNTLEITDAITAEAQIEFHRWALSMVVPGGSRLRVLEIGHNKGMFGLLLSSITSNADLTAIDPNPRAALAADILNRDTSMTVRFLEGTSQNILPALSESFDYAWIDGCHQTEALLLDLRACARLRIPWIAVDDTAYRSVNKAVTAWLDNSAYVEVPNPFLAYDCRKARLFTRDTQIQSEPA